MKFQYEYRTSDNVRHAGVVVASDREAAFQALKSQGIRPGKLAEAPGFFNRLFGKGKRWLTIGVLGALLVVVLVAWVGADRRAARALNEAQSTRQEAQFLTDTTRRQVIGDAAVIEKGIRTGWADVFAEEGDRFLASFAIPGVKAGVRNTSVEALESCLKEDADFRSSTSTRDFDASSLEARQIVAMVEGMKDEARRFVAAGGSLRRYGQRLVERQEAEIAICEKVEREIRGLKKSGMGQSELEELWERRNAELRRMGIRPVSLPE